MSECQEKSLWCQSLEVDQVIEQSLGYVSFILFRLTVFLSLLHLLLKLLQFLQLLGLLNFHLVLPRKSSFSPLYSCTIGQFLSRVAASVSPTQVVIVPAPPYCRMIIYQHILLVSASNHFFGSQEGIHCFLLIFLNLSDSSLHFDPISLHYVAHPARIETCSLLLNTFKYLLSKCGQSSRVQLHVVLFNVLIGKVVLLLQHCFFSDCIQISQLFEIVVFTLQCSRFRVEFSRVHIQVVEIFCSILSITSCIEPLKLFLIGFGGESSCQQWIVVSFAFVFLSFYLFADFLVLLKVIDDFTVHFWSISVPTISFYFPCISHFFDKVVGSYSFTGITSSNFAWTLGALFPIMPHGSTVLTCSFTVMGGLVPLLTSLIPLFDEAFRFVDWDFNQFSSTFGVLSVPGQLFYILRCILLFLHLLYKMMKGTIFVKHGHTKAFFQQVAEIHNQRGFDRTLQVKLGNKNKQGRLIKLRIIVLKRWLGSTTNSSRNTRSLQRLPPVALSSASVTSSPNSSSKRNSSIGRGILISSLWASAISRLLYISGTAASCPVLPPNKPVRVFGSMLFDQLMFAPILLTVFYPVNQMVIERDVKAFKRGVEAWKAKIEETLLSNWKIWPVATYINFYLMPMQYQVLFANFVGLFWNMILSYIASK